MPSEYTYELDRDELMESLPILYYFKVTMDSPISFIDIYDPFQQDEINYIGFIFSDRSMSHYPKDMLKKMKPEKYDEFVARVKIDSRFLGSVLPKVVPLSEQSLLSLVHNHLKECKNKDYSN